MLKLGRKLVRIGLNPIMQRWVDNPQNMTSLIQVTCGRPNKPTIPPLLRQTLHASKCIPVVPPSLYVPQLGKDRWPNQSFVLYHLSHGSNIDEMTKHALKDHCISNIVIDVERDLPS